MREENLRFLEEYSKIQDDDLRKVSFVPASTDGVPRPEMKNTLQPLGSILIYADMNFENLETLIVFDLISALTAGCGVTLVTRQKLENQDLEILDGFRRSLRATTWAAEKFSLSEEIPESELGRLCRESSPGGVLLNMPEAEASGVCKRILAEMHGPCPVFASGLPSANFSFWNRGSTGNFPKTREFLEYLRNCRDCRFGGSFFLFLPLEEGKRWEKGLRQKIHDAGLVSISGALADFLRRGYLKKRDWKPDCTILFYRNRTECLDWIRSTTGRFPIQLLGFPDGDESDHPLLEEIEWKASILSHDCFPSFGQLRASSSMGSPLCANLLGGEGLLARLLVSRFLRPLCYQEIPDEYLPKDRREATP